MTFKRICLIAGTRPEAIKLAPVYFELRKSTSLAPLWLSTGQHRELLDQAMGAFGLRPDLDLGLMRDGQEPINVLSRAIEGVAKFLAHSRPSAVLVQGDTTTVLAAGLAAFYNRIPIGHVEAGLRTYDMNSPWPEEMNRRLTAPLCQWSFAPTEQAKANLLAERIPAERCHVTGNTGIDAVLEIRRRLTASTEPARARADRIGISKEFQQRFFERKGRWILLTLHRRESFGAALANICAGILKILEENSELGVVCPMHLNPEARRPVVEALSRQSDVALIEPVAYQDFVWLMSEATLIVTDSGGVQEEAPSLGKPVIVARETTERMEGVDAGTSELVGANSKKLAEAVSRLLNDENEYRKRASVENPYGDGQASSRIRAILERSLCQT